MNAFLLKRELKALILLLVRAHPMGLRVLLGEIAPPSDEEISQMLGILQDEIDLEIRIDKQSGQDNSLPEAVRIVERADSFNRVVEHAGGWKHINAVTREWAEHYKHVWPILVDYFKWVSSSFARLEGSQVEKITEKYGVCARTVYSYAAEFPTELARVILLTPVDCQQWDLCAI